MPKSFRLTWALPQPPLGYAFSGNALTLLRWRYWQAHLHPHQLVFIDETGANTKMSRLRGRALRGQRVIGKVPHGHWKTTTFVGALRVTGMTAPMVVDGAMNGRVFLAYVEQQLAPTLRQGDTVIMDNLW